MWPQANVQVRTWLTGAVAARGYESPEEGDADSPCRKRPLIAMNPLMFANWRSIATTFTVICWLAVVVLAVRLVDAVQSQDPPPHRASMLVR